MSTTVLEVTKEELRALVEAMVEEKLATIFHDPEDDLELTDELRELLARQEERVRNGDRGESFEDVVGGLNLD